MKLKPEWKYAAMDESGEWCFYKDVPERGEDAWYGGDWVAIQSIFIFPEVEDWTKSLHTITEEGELVPYVDVPADGERVMVRDGVGWVKRYSAGRLSNSSGKCLICYTNGQDKWSTDGSTKGWYKWRRPTEEELI